MYVYSLDHLLDVSWHLTQILRQWGHFASVQFFTGTSTRERRPTLPQKIEGRKNLHDCKFRDSIVLVYKNSLFCGKPGTSHLILRAPGDGHNETPLVRPLLASFSVWRYAGRWTKQSHQIIIMHEYAAGGRQQRKRVTNT